MDIDQFLETLRPLSDQYGTGDPRGDLMTLLAALLLVAGALLVLFLITGRKSGPRMVPAAKAGDGFDRYSSLAGKFEKLEMNSNASRSELMREIEFLKGRVDALEDALRASPVSTDRGTLDSYMPPSLEDQREGSSYDLAPPPPPLSDFPGLDEPTSVGEENSENVLDFADAPASERKPTVALDENQLSHIREDAVIPAMSQSLEPSEEERPLKVHSDSPTSLSDGLGRTRTGLFKRIKEVFSGKPTLSEELVEELQAFLVSTDLGVKMVRTLTTDLKEGLKRGDEVTEDRLLVRLRELVADRLRAVNIDSKEIIPIRRGNSPLVVMMVGVNGVGKTTTTAKLAAVWKEQGAKILLVAADTFRAAATEQLKRWGDELGIDVHAGAEGAKPSTVVYDAMERAKDERFDVVLIDTAGRLHTKGNLMQELEGVKNVVKRHDIAAPHEILLVIDGTTGQNALHQAKEFHAAVNLTGLVVTKLDGTSKGGIVVAVQDEYEIPVRYIGMGEAADDLKVFDVDDYVDALFDSSEMQELSEPSAHGKRRRRRREDDQVAEI
ncbi:MAG: signal recognition particle-docking protein FtsY [Bdellovibrionales bacterium]|nr:signal recognition particle-docking protein FtsY [Bdellovibrionales bacterium]